MSKNNMGLLQYLAWLEKQEQEHLEALSELKIAIAHARRAAKELGSQEELPTPVAAHRETVTEQAAKGGARGPYAGLGIEEAAHQHLVAAGKTLKTAEVRDGVKEGGIETESKSFHSTIFTSLRRLVDKGKVEKVGSGKWRAVEAKSDLPPWLEKG